MDPFTGMSAMFCSYIATVEKTQTCHEMSTDTKGDICMSFIESTYSFVWKVIGVGQV